MSVMASDYNLMHEQLMLTIIVGIDFVLVVAYHIQGFSIHSDLTPLLRVAMYNRYHTTRTCYIKYRIQLQSSKIKD